MGNRKLSNLWFSHIQDPYGEERARASSYPERGHHAVLIFIPSSSSFSPLFTDARSSIQLPVNWRFWIMCCKYHSFNCLCINSRAFFDLTRWWWLLVSVSRTALASICRLRSTSPITCSICTTLCTSRSKATTPKCASSNFLAFSSRGPKYASCASKRPSRCNSPLGWAYTKTLVNPLNWPCLKASSVV